MRIVIFGDGAWAANSVSGLLDAGHTITGVVLRTRASGPELEEVAVRAAVPVLQPARVNDPEFIEVVKSGQPDLGISIAYNQIFRPSPYGFLRHGLVNFHAGKLPFYRGRNVINWAILNGEKEIGLTAHFVDEGIDTGRIILQRLFPIGWTEGYGEVLGKIVSCFPAFVRETVNQLEQGVAEIRPQPGDGTYFPGRGPADEWLDWNDSSFNLHNKIRAITRPAPGARTLLGEKEVRIWRAFYEPAWPKYIATPGAVVGRSESGVLVKTGDSVLLIQEIEMDGKGPQAPQWRPGIKLGGDFHVG